MSINTIQTRETSLGSILRQIVAGAGHGMHRALHPLRASAACFAAAELWVSMRFSKSYRLQQVAVPVAMPAGEPGCPDSPSRYRLRHAPGRRQTRLG